MKAINHRFPWLELIDRPAFCVKDGVVIAVNSAVEQRMLRIGTDICDIVTEHRNVYEEFESGCLYLTIHIGGFPCNANVIRDTEYDIFLIHPDTNDDHLQNLALAAQKLRLPLANAMTATDMLLANLDLSDSDTQCHAKHMNQSLFQLLRIISNMSDAGSYLNKSSNVMQTVDLTAVIHEILEKARTITADKDVHLSYTGIETPILGLANTEKLERAIYNLLSNALKFALAGSIVDVKLTKNGGFLSFAVCNINAEQPGDHSFWSRYRREPGIEDSRYGLGLGMTLISSVASAHGGTVLIDHPSPAETRVTMTIAIIKDNTGTVRSPTIRIGDYAGGRDKGLLELSEVLHTDLYKEIN